MTDEVYSSGGIDSNLMLEPVRSDPPSDAKENGNGTSALPIIIDVSDNSVSSDSGSSDSDEPISRKARKLANALVKGNIAWVPSLKHVRNPAS